MKNYRLKTITVILLLYLGMAINAQQVVLTSGCSSSNTGGSVCYSVGQLSYSYFTGSFGSVSEGVQQTASGIIIGINDSKEIRQLFYAYPNPASNFLKLIVNDYPVENLSYQLFDLTGKMLLDNRITSIETSIDLRAQLPAIYFLKVIDNKRDVKIFKIIKK